MNIFDKLRAWWFRNRYLFVSIVVGTGKRLWRRWINGDDRIHVFISSTYTDLQLERFAVIFELTGPYHVIAMERHKLAREEDKKARGYPRGSPEERSDDVEYAMKWSSGGVQESDIVIFLLAGRYGFRPYGGILGTHSITHFEAGWAYEYGKPILAYRLKRPLDDEEAFRAHYAWAESWAFPVAPTDTCSPGDDQLEHIARAIRPVDMYVSFAGIKDIGSGEVLIQRIRKDVDAMAWKMELALRATYLLFLALIALPAWWLWTRVLN